MKTYIVYERIPTPRKSDCGWAVGNAKEIAVFSSLEEAQDLASQNDRYIVLRSNERYKPDEHYNLKEVSQNLAFKRIYKAIQDAIANSPDPYQTATSLLRLEAELKPAISIGNRAFKEYLSDLLARLALSPLQSQMVELIDKFGCGIVGNMLSAYALSKKKGRKEGFSPINGDGGAMVKGSKKWSMPQDDWDWLESQPNQSETIRQAIQDFRRK